MVKELRFSVAIVLSIMGIFAKGFMFLPVSFYYRNGQTQSRVLDGLFSWFLLFYNQLLIYPAAAESLFPAGAEISRRNESIPIISLARAMSSLAERLRSEIFDFVS